MSYLRNAPVRPRRPSVRRFHCASMCGPIGACTYLAGCALPLPWDIPLVVLALLSVLALVSGFRNSPSSWSPIVLHVLIFFVAMAFSTLVSVDVGRSVWLSAPILPAVLLFFVVAEQFGDIRDTRLLYLTFSAVGLGLASMLLWAAWKH